MPIDREKILQSAQKYVERKKYDRAIEEYQRVVHDDPNDARTLLKIGDLQSRIQAYADAVATYDRVGHYYATQGFSLKAIAVYKQIRELIRKHAPELSPSYRHVAPRLAEIYTQLGLTSDALAAYDEVASMLQREGHEREALDVFKKMVALDDGNPLPHLRLAEACCRVQAVDQAINSFWTAAELLLKLDRRDDALKVVERIMHFRQDERFARVAAELYLSRGQREDGLQALAKLQICFQADPRNLETLGLLAQAFTIIGQSDKSVEVYKEMARLAREQGKLDLFGELLAHLVSVAPHDEQVRALQLVDQYASQPPPSGSVPPPSVTDIDSEVELLDEDDVTDDELVDDEPARYSRDPEAPRAPMVSGPDVVVVDDDYGGAEEEYLGAEAFDAQAHSRKAVLDAESFRRLRLYPKALETLRIALEVDPRSREIRDKLRQILAESGDRNGAIDATIDLATMALAERDPSGAEALLYEVLEIEPDEPRALELLDRIAGKPAGGSAGGQRDPYSHESPLPSYGLESVRPSGAMGSEPKLSRAEPELDDPFGAGSPPEPQRLPSFPLPGEDDLMAGLDASRNALSSRDAARPRSPSFSDVQADDDFRGERGTAPTEGAAAETIEEALEEADFFTSRGLYDDARAILNEQLKRTPKHPLLVERLGEINDAVHSKNASGTIERSQLGTSEADDSVFDIAASLEALDELPAGRSAVGSFASIDEEVDVDQVFAKFKEGVRAQVDESDSATHYDLGVAYKEMGLLADAMNEFEVAARDAARECMCFAMIGLIQLEQNRLDEAANTYKRALNARLKTVDQEMSLYYDLGNVYEMKGDLKDALYYFQRIARRDPGYRDVKDRIAALQPAPAAAAPARAVNDDDEFERAFGELFNNK